MAYFPNGESGMIYMDHYCCKCVNYRDNGSGSEGCPILDLHFLWNYEAVGKDGDKTKAAALNHFIPIEDVHNGECVMFQKPIVPTQRELERLGQLRML